MYGNTTYHFADEIPTYENCFFPFIAAAGHTVDVLRLPKSNFVINPRWMHACKYGTVIIPEIESCGLYVESFYYGSKIGNIVCLGSTPPRLEEMSTRNFE